MRKVDEEFQSAVAAGEKILLLPNKSNIREPLNGRFVPVFWSPVHFPNQPGALGSMIESEHPVFANFPTDNHSDWQWWELLANSTSVNTTSLGPNFNPVMRFVDKFNRNDLAACLWETRIGQASVFICTLDIESDLHERIVARQLSQSLREYLSSDKFSPPFSCEIATFANLFQDTAAPLKKQSALGNLASAVSKTPVYFSGSVASTNNAVEGVRDTKFVWEEKLTDLGFVVETPIEKGMVYTATFKMGQYGKSGYSVNPIKFSIKARKSKDSDWKVVEELVVKDMLVSGKNRAGKYGHYMLTMVADEHPDLFGYDQLLLEAEELEPWTQGYLGAVEISSEVQQKDRSPNIVFVLADDLGWKDLGCYGSSFYDTPNCDRLAREGIRFTNAYAAAPVCSPTRISILTGKHPARTQTTEYFGGPTAKQWRETHNTRVLSPAITEHLELDEITLPEMLRSRGYKTFFAGKWHCGEEPFWPQYQGFQQNLGGWTQGGPYGGEKYFSPYENPMLKDGPAGEHLPDRLASETIDFIERNSDRPFFAFLSMYSVHTPLMARKDLQAKYEKKRERLKLEAKWSQEDSVWGDKPMGVRMTQDAVYAGMVEAMDQAVGRVMATLDRLLLTENTIVIFVSDNGGLSTSSGKWVPTSCAPLRAGKGWLYEGGIRVPMMIRWPQMIAAEKTSDTPVITNDLFATLASVTGQDRPKEEFRDGNDLSGLWQEQDFPPRNLYWHYPHFGNQGGFPGAVVRSGDWKLIRNFENNTTELYNLKQDIGETRNQAAEQAEIAFRLTKDLEKWQNSVNAKPTKKNASFEMAR
jgi:arylsulfatase A-like enzyme